MWDFPAIIFRPRERIQTCELEIYFFFFFHQQAERKTEHDLLAKLEEAKEAYLKVEEEMRSEAEKLNCQKNQLQKRNEEIRSEIESLKKKQQELKCKLSKKRHKRNFWTQIHLSSRF